jgi:hypothetical protein
LLNAKLSKIQCREFTTLPNSKVNNGFPCNKRQNAAKHSTEVTDQTKIKVQMITLKSLSN